MSLASMATVQEIRLKANEKDGKNLLGSPTFTQLENGRFKCVETGHELPQHSMDSYASSKRCRIGLINFSLSESKPPLNMFSQDPLCRSKLICKLTGDTVNKSEEHIWKHISGRRFLNMLEQMEAGRLAEDLMLVKEEGRQGKVEMRKKGEMMMMEKKMVELVSEMRDPGDSSDSEGPEFWMPPDGDGWEFGNGRDRRGSASELGGEEDEDDMSGSIDEANPDATAELSMRTKRMSMEVGPSSFASRKKKNKIKSPS